jgi:hypothetical protein
MGNDMGKLARCVLAVVVMAAGISGWGKLPEEALKRGREAEKLVQAGKLSEAITAWGRVDKAYPGNAPVSLRLAELHDQLGQYGPALFYYRRYVQLSKDGATEDARARLLTLEQMARVPDEAAEFAKKLGVESERVAVPATVVEESQVQVKPDGSIIPLKGTDPGTSAPQVKPRAAIVLTPVGSSATTVSKEQEYVLITPIRGGSTPASTTGTAGAKRNRTVITVEPPEAQPAGRVPPVPKASAAPSSPEAGSETGMVPPPGAIRDEVGRVTDDLTRPKSAFFTVSKGTGPNARIKLTNAFPESVMTFGAIPASGVEPVNAILTGGESRDLGIAPGRYRVKIGVNDSGYPPGELFETEFEMVFDAGMCYTRSVSAKNTQRLN